MLRGGASVGAALWGMERGCSAQIMQVRATKSTNVCFLEGRCDGGGLGGSEQGGAAQGGRRNISQLG